MVEAPSPLPSPGGRGGKRAFTLVEMLVASVLAAVLMGGVMVMLGAMGRERRVVAARAAVGPGRVAEMLEWDLTNAAAVAVVGGGRAVVLEGHGGIDPATLGPSQRLARVVYRVVKDGAGARLYRQQVFLDDAVRPEPWTELVAVGVERVSVSAASGDGGAMSMAPGAWTDLDERGQVVGGRPVVFRVPTRVTLVVEGAEVRVEKELWMR